MTTKNLSTATTDMIASYGNTAQNVINAYQASGERVVSVLEQRWNTALKESRSQLTTEVATNAAAAQLAFSVYYTKGLTQTTKNAQLVVSQLVKIAAAGVERVAANASTFTEKTGVTTLNSVAQAAAPGVAVLGKLAAQIEQKSADLVHKISGNDIETAHVKRTSPFSQKRATRAA
jgi:hypothetical protein